MDAGSLKSKFTDPRRGLRLGCVRVVAPGICLMALCACKAEFSGPYPCETGYASCVNPGDNQCETDITADAAHCGVCGNACDVGAMCLDSVCSAGAVKLADIQNGSVPNIAVNSTGLYWAASGDSQIT